MFFHEFCVLCMETSVSVSLCLSVCLVLSFLPIVTGPNKSYRRRRSFDCTRASLPTICDIAAGLIIIMCKYGICICRASPHTHTHTQPETLTRNPIIFYVCYSLAICKRGKKSLGLLNAIN